MEGSPAIPGVVWGGFVARAFALEGAGPCRRYGRGFFVVCGDGRLALSEDSVVEGLALAEEGDGAVEALTDGDGGATEAVAVALALDLVLAAAVTAGEIAAELSGGMEGEDEVRAAESWSRLRWGVLGGFWGTEKRWCQPKAQMFPLSKTKMSPFVGGG